MATKETTIQHGLEQYRDWTAHNLAMAEAEVRPDRWAAPGGHYHQRGAEILRAQGRFARWWREHGRRDVPEPAT